MSSSLPFLVSGKWLWHTLYRGRNCKSTLRESWFGGNCVRDRYRFPLCSNKLKTVGGSEKEINGKNLLLIAMMKKLEAFVEAGGFWLYEDLCPQSKTLENCQLWQKVQTHDSRTWFTFAQVIALLPSEWFTALAHIWRLLVFLVWGDHIQRSL